MITEEEELEDELISITAEQQWLKEEIEILTGEKV